MFFGGELPPTFPPLQIASFISPTQKAYAFRAPPGGSTKAAYRFRATPTGGGVSPGYQGDYPPLNVLSNGTKGGKQELLWLS